MSRSIGITYGSLTIGKGQTGGAYELTDKFSLSINKERASLEFEVIVYGTTESAFLTAEAALVSAYKTPREALTVVLGSADRFDFDPGENTGFAAEPDAEKLGGVEDTGQSSRYRCSVVVELPADWGSQAGRRTSRVTVDLDSSERRTVTISGTYTALSGNEARDQYDSQKASYASSVLSGVDGSATWELVGETAGPETDGGKLIDFALAYREILSDQGASSRDVGAIVDPQLSIRRVGEGEVGEFDGLGSVGRLVSVEVSYSCAVRRSVTTDLRNLYVSTIRPAILKQVSEQAALTGLAIVREASEASPYGNAIGVTMLIQADSGARFLSIRQRTRDRINPGKRLVPVHNGNPYARDLYYGPASHIRAVTRDIIQRRGRGYPPAPTFAGFEQIEEMREADPFVIGLPGARLQLELVVQSFFYERADVGRRPSGETPLRLPVVQRISR